MHISKNGQVGELWPSIVEKAYAKMYGGYDKIFKQGNVMNCLRDLTGAPTQKIMTNENDDIIDKIQTNLYSNFIVGAVASKSQNGLEQGCAYTITGCPGDQQIIMKSSNSPIEGFNFNESDQTFSMTLEEFQANFEHIVVCQLKKS